MHVLAFYQIFHILQLQYAITIFLQQSNEYSEVIEGIKEMTYDTIFGLERFKLKIIQKIKKILKTSLVYL